MTSTWTAVDEYIAERLLPVDAALTNALAGSAEGGLAPISVTPPQGAFLHLLARLRGARRILELGALGGYSTIWLARALGPDGRLLSLEIDPRAADVARASVAAAGLANRVEIRIGPAAEAMAPLPSDDPFDLVFIDADKRSTADYFDAALRLVRPGGVIVADNVVRDGAIVDATSHDESILGSRRFFDAVHDASGIVATALQTVGAQGYDGFAIVLVETPTPRAGS